MMKRSEPYQDSLQLVSQSPQVIEGIGEPIEPGFFVTGSIQLSNNDGEAQLNYSISGPEGKALILVEGTKTGGQWSYEKITCVLPSGRMLQIANTTEEDAPEE